jgi:hypothetical protein
VIVNVGKVGATLAGFLLPFLPFALVLGLAALIARRISRRRRRAEEPVVATE